MQKSIPLISGVNAEYYISITASMCPITRYAAALTAYQRPKSYNKTLSYALPVHCGLLRISHIIQEFVRRLKLFGHTARAEVELDHHRALRAAIRGPPPAWRRPPGRPRQTWTRTVEADLRPLNIGLHTPWCRAQDRTTWKKLMRTATPCPGAYYY